MTNSIVTLNVTQQVAPTPSKLQQTGALLSQGATTTAAGTKSLLTAKADLTALLRTALAITSITWNTNVATVTTAAPHGFTTSDVFPITIAGATPSGYNGTFNATITGASTFTYPLTPNPGSETVPGTYIVAAVAELTAMANTFFGQGASVAVYVLELGPGLAADGVSYLDDWITANPGVFYSYLTPVSWADESTFLALLADFEALDAKTYFFVQMDNGNYADFTDTMKCVVGLIPAPSGVPATEFTTAATHFDTLRYDPSPAIRVTPLAFQFQFGVTPFPLPGNGALLQTYADAFINYVDTGSEGGISNLILKWGTTKDGNDFSYWYSVDWVQINGAENLANAIINGSNNPQNPLYLDQNGINRLQSVLANTMQTGIAVGLVFGDIVQTALDATAFQVAIDADTYPGKTVVNAIPFNSYYKAFPGQYADGIYNGLAVSYVPKRGFKRITFNLSVSDFVA